MASNGPAKALRDALAAATKLSANLDPETADEMAFDELKRTLHGAQSSLGQLKADWLQKEISDRPRQRSSPSTIKR